MKSIRQRFLTIKNILNKFRTGSGLPDPQLFIYDADDFNTSNEMAPDGFPVTPFEYRHSSAINFEIWMEAGKEHFDSMLKDLRMYGFQIKPGLRILDFGCSSGRTIRLWKDYPEIEVWGSEISFERTMWCKQNIGMPFRFVQTSINPPLPFEDRFFDLVYAGSVFTHISHGIDTWLVEMRRVIQPGGFFYLTIHDETTWRLMVEQKNPIINRFLENIQSGENDELPHDFISIDRDAASQVFFRSEYFRTLVSPYFSIEAYIPETRGYQSALVLRRNQ